MGCRYYLRGSMQVLTRNVDLGYMSVVHTERHKYDITYLSLPILALFA